MRIKQSLVRYRELQIETLKEGLSLLEYSDGNLNPKVAIRLGKTAVANYKKYSENLEDKHWQAVGDICILLLEGIASELDYHLDDVELDPSVRVMICEFISLVSRTLLEDKKITLDVNQEFFKAMPTGFIESILDISKD